MPGIRTAYSQAMMDRQLPEDIRTDQLRRQIDELRRALRWEKTQKERLLDDLAIFRRENQRLRESLDEWESRQEETAL